MTGDITVIELKQRLDAGENLNIIDVREPWEFEEANINGQLIPLGDLQGRIDDLDCKSGARSAAAADYMTKQGFTNVRNLTGGILAWLGQSA